MGLAAELILAVADLIHMAFNIYILILVVRVLLTWVNPDPYNPIVRFLHSATDPLLDRVRRLIPLQFGGIDFSPIVLLVAFNFVQRIVNVMLHRLAASL